MDEFERFIAIRAVELGAKRVVFTFSIPIKATSTLNSRLHWIVRWRKSKAEKAATTMAFLARRGNRLRWKELGKPLQVKLIRVGPREMDDDNLAGSLKGVRDAIALCLGYDDGDRKNIVWSYEQSRGAYAVNVEIRPTQVGVFAVHGDGPSVSIFGRKDEQK